MRVGSSRDGSYSPPVYLNPYLFRPLFALAGLVLLLSCGKESAPPPPEPEVRVAVPEPTPAPLEDVRLYHVRLDERLVASHMPVLSPLDGIGRREPLPAGFVTASALAGSGGGPDVAAVLKQLEEGSGPSGGALALVEWNVRWADSVGRARFWGVCSLPCTVTESFVAGPDHYPLDPVLHPLAMFAHRPGHAPLTLREMSGGLEVQQGESVLWTEGGPRAAGSWAEEVVVLWLEADLAEVTEKKIEASRSLSVAAVDQTVFVLTEGGAPLPQSIRVLPELRELTAAAKPRAVEGVQEAWPWPEASRFEGGFVARPNPADFGLSLDRTQGLIRWTPTLSQAVDGKAEFVTHELMRTGGVKTTVSPFPGGAEVLGAVALLERRLVLASAKTGYEEQPRVQEVKRLLLRFEDLLPLPERAASTGTRVIYLSDEPVGLVEGPAGSEEHGFVVSSLPGEERSVARVWARLLLGRHAGVRSVAADDLALWFEGELLRRLYEKRAAASGLLSSPEASEGPLGLFVPAFAAAGDDIVGEWKYRVRGEKHEGRPDPSEFLAYLGSQLPQVERDVRRMIALASVAQTWERALPMLPEEGLVQSVSLDGLRGASVWGAIPAGGDSPSWTVRVTPETPGVTPVWSWGAVPRSVWEARGSTATKGDVVVDRLGASLGTKLQRRPAATPKRPVRRAAPSQIRAMSEQPAGGTGGTAPEQAAGSSSADGVSNLPEAPPSEAVVERSPDDQEELVVYVVLWSSEVSEARVELIPNPPEAVAEPELKEDLGQGGGAAEPSEDSQAAPQKAPPDEASAPSAEEG